jgi:hypothetical protein
MPSMQALFYHQNNKIFYHLPDMQGSKLKTQWKKTQK